MNKDNKAAIRSRAKRIRLLIMDVDGVLTPGYIAMSDSGSEIKFFDVLDGFGLVLWQRAGLKSAIITAGTTGAVNMRARYLKIDKIYQGVREKSRVYDEIKEELKVKDSEICFIGDDLIDLPILKRVGLACCVRNASEDIMPYVHYISRREGGRGAVREIIDLILKSKGLWKEVTRDYFTNVKA